MISAVALDGFFVEQQGTGHQKYRAFATISLTRKLGFKSMDHNCIVSLFFSLFFLIQGGKVSDRIHSSQIWESSGG